METVTVVDVNDKGNGWFDVEFEDGRKASTKERKLADTAFQSKNNPVLVDLNVKQGKAKEGGGFFENIYLNKIEAATQNGGDAPLLSAPAPAEAAAPAPAIPTQSDKDKRIAAQWAYGRAVELLAASGQEYTVPLDSDGFAALEVQARALLTASGILATQ